MSVFWRLIDRLSLFACALLGYWGIYQWGKEKGKAEERK